VGSLESAAAFYHGALGLDLTVWSYPGALFLAAGGYHHHLGVNTWSPGPSATNEQARLIDWELLVPGEDHAALAVERLSKAGWPTDGRDGEWVATDPWGTDLRLRHEG
jgi:catechol 2,3-dioxygenase